MKFKKCSCGHGWDSRDEFMADPLIEVVGYQVDFEDLKEGLFLFNHLNSSCRTTISVSAKHFFDLYKGPIFPDRLVGGANCPGYCLRRGELRPCPAKCECAFVREILKTVSEWPKKPAA